MMNEEMKDVKIGLLLVMLALLFGIGLGAGFGVAEDSVKSYISEGVASHAGVHVAKSNKKIWRYAQRAHFHSTGIAAFSIGLILLIMFSSLKRKLKKNGLNFNWSRWTVSAFMAHYVYSCTINWKKCSASSFYNGNIYLHWCGWITVRYCNFMR